MFERFGQNCLPELEKTLKEIVSTYPDNNANFDTMLSYPMGWVEESGAVHVGETGKRLRPLLLLLVAESAGGDWRSALPAAAAVELLHNFSLIHDDIQDNSEFRHNRPTVWKIWGLANAINVGDALFALAYVALEKLSEFTIPDETLLRIWQIFNSTNLELTRGQHLDMLFETQAIITEEEYVSMISGKTGALIAACTQIGTLIATHNSILAHHLAKFGRHLGIAFQMRDDILGIWGNPLVTGKSAATDIISRKKSLPVIYGLQRSSDLASLYQLDAFEDTHVAEVISILNVLGAEQHTQAVEQDHFNLAMESLEQALPNQRAIGTLQDFVSILMQRSH